MTKRTKIAMLGAAVLALSAGYAAAADQSVRPAPAVESRTTSVTALFVPTDGTRVSKPRAKCSASSQRVPSCSYVCHWHGQIKHCFPACR